jgi:large subunit ribosomal protein L13
MTTKLADIKHDRHELSAEGEVLGRFATKIATLLVGKSKPYFVRHLDCGDFVTVTNAQKIITTGRKDEKKIYTRYSGYPGGLKSKTLKTLRAENPAEVIRHAVWGMLPNNKLRSIWIKRLKVVA